MKIKILLSLTVMILLALQAKSQSELPVIHSRIDVIDIRDGNEFIKGNWSLAPEAKPDIYTSNKIGEFVTFYTDLDSISYKIHPDSIYNFIILLNGRDSAYTQIKYAPTYLDILKRAEDFNYSEIVEIPDFYYQDSSELTLRTLRKQFNLDSIAGGGNEVSKILNLMHWIHDLIPHDGNHENPIVKNAMSMIAECKQGARGLNCRGLATVLNECYLSLGIKSRFVTCMPKDSIFNDCHVINMVFSEQLGKWIWIDPTNDAYVMDEKGELLGLSEVRERLIKGETIILNPDANWNNQASTVKEYYLFEYMAKNLYRFSCPLRSEYDYETNQQGKTREYVELIPLDGYNQTPKISELTYEKSGVTFKTYKTNNPNQFWVNPR
ncbi:MAG: transglutaminase domain-containing protein [Phaeodactylibacter sp.]|nr:transglutaminase domain-containing protein [Phaeodactylibacter sp.]MCB2092350.1 transglutaminase domain-containing protein [Alphaproteobacteria bacterium]MCB9300422.1 transglutaminase domain-containing protein [Lewinellaceae bacterium]